MADLIRNVLRVTNASQRINRWWLSLPMRVKGSTVIAIPVCGLLISVVIFFWLQHIYTLAATWVQHTQLVRLEAQYLQHILVDAETGVRGYSITRQKAFLEPYNNVRNELPVTLQRLRDRVADNATQQQRVDQIAGLSAQHADLLAEHIVLADSIPVDQAFAVQLSAKLQADQAIMDSVRQEIARFLAEEERLQQERDIAFKGWQTTILLILLALALFGTIGAWFAAFLFSAGITQRLTELSKNTQRLASGEELLPLADSSDELGQLMHAFNAMAIALREQDLLLHKHSDELEQTVEIRTAALRASEERFHQALDNMLEGCQIIGFDCRYLYVNDSVVVHSRQAKEDLLGYTMMEVYPGIEATEMFAALQRCMDQRIPHRMQNRFVYPEGSTAWFDLSIQPSPEGVFVLSIDISERKQAEAEALRLNEELEQRVTIRTAELAAANQELEAFSYSVSHDLRAPLRAINGFSRILMDDYSADLPKEALRYLGMLCDNTQQMGQLIDDLLAFSRLSRQPLAKQSVDMEQLVQQCLQELLATHKQRQIDIKVSQLSACQADPRLLKQVWINLISNALKYTSQRELTQIEIGYHIIGDEPVYMIKDNGVGFDMRYSEKLFGVFQRLHHSEDYEGTGVGLAIVQRIIQRHGGRIWAEAAINQGATFYFTIPRATA